MENEDRLPLSYVSQYGYCPRRAAFLMNYQQWEENEYTAEGRDEHQRVHTGRVERRGDFLKLYDFYVWSDKLMLSGKCDCIEAYKCDNGALLPEEEYSYSLYPIEYKHGKVRKEHEYMMQLCAQAMCLEEMYRISILEGTLFYIDVHQRMEVQLNSSLREETAKTAQELWHTHDLPKAEASAKCKKCSINEICMPKLSNLALNYCDALFKELKGV